MKQISIILLLLVTQLISSQKLYFMPNDSQKAIKDFTHDIKYSQQNIKAVIYSFTHHKISKALKKATKNGVKVTILYDKANTHAKNSTLKNLALYNKIETRIVRGKRAKKGYYGKMHAKFMIIDDRILYFGSANWSHSAFGKNYEILYKTTDKKLIKEFNLFYDEIYSKSKLYK